MSRLLARMDEIIRDLDDSDFGELCNMVARLLPYLVEMVKADDEGTRAGAAHNEARNAVSDLVLDMAADRATLADTSLLAALREPWP